MEEPDKKMRGKFDTAMGSDGDGSDDEDMHLLPRHTKVVVTGNNRTKTALVGQRGVVRKAVVRIFLLPPARCRLLTSYTTTSIRL